VDGFVLPTEKTMSDGPVLAAIARLELAFDASLRDVRGDMTDLRTETTGIRTEMTDLRAEMTSIRTEVASIRTETTGIRADMTQMRAAVMDRIDRLQDRVTEIRDDISVAMGSADAMQRANDNTREMVRLQGEQLSIMFRQIKRLEEKVRNITGES
jgi:chromosome segregation ATPase